MPRNGRCIRTSIGKSSMRSRSEMPRAPPMRSAGTSSMCVPRCSECSRRRGSPISAHPRGSGDPGTGEAQEGAGCPLPRTCAGIGGGTPNGRPGDGLLHRNLPVNNSITSAGAQSKSSDLPNGGRSQSCQEVLRGRPLGDGLSMTGREYLGGSKNGYNRKSFKKLIAYFPRFNGFSSNPSSILDRPRTII
jgi:hypothetical protein